MKVKFSDFFFETFFPIKFLLEENGVNEKD